MWHSLTLLALLAVNPRLAAADSRPPLQLCDARARCSTGPMLIAQRGESIRKDELCQHFTDTALLEKVDVEAAQEELGSSRADEGVDELMRVSIGASVLQIVNNVAGAGILTLSAGMSGGVGSIPASLLCLLLGVISGLTFHMIGAACELTGQTTFKGLWASTLGSSTTWVVDTAVAAMCLSAAIIYSGILGDISTQLFALAGVPAALNRRGLNIAAITISALTPLSLLKDLSALAFTSVLGCIAVAYTAVFICLRCLDGSYSPPGGLHLVALPATLLPAFEKASRWRLNARALVLTSNLGLAYIAHYNAPAFYRSLERRSTERFGIVCAASFGLLSLLYLGIMLAGYFTFGDVTAANILKNYAEKDALATLGRVATFASILFGFPLAMLGLKDATLSLLVTAPTVGPLGTAMHAIAASHQRLLVAALLAVISAIAITITDIGLVVGVSGALLGAAIVYIFPALIYLAARPQSRDIGPSQRHLARSVCTGLVYSLVPLGTFLGILGVYMTLVG